MVCILVLALKLECRAVWWLGCGGVLPVGWSGTSTSAAAVKVHQCPARRLHTAVQLCLARERGFGVCEL